MGVLGAERADGRVPDVTDEQVRAHVARDLRDVDRGVVVDRTAPHQHLTALIEADAPAELPFATAPERLRLGGEHTTGEVRAIPDQAEQTCHLVDLLSAERVQVTIRPVA